MFLAGKTKCAKRGAAIGLHSASNLDGSPNAFGTAAMAAFLATVKNMPASVIEAKRETRADEMHWLTQAEKDALGIVTLESAQRVKPPAPDTVVIEIEGIGEVAARFQSRTLPFESIATTASSAVSSTGRRL